MSFFTGKRRFQKGIRNFQSKVVPQNPRSHCQYICVIVKPCLLAERVSAQRAQRIPAILFAEILMPIPVVQITIPMSASPAATASCNRMVRKRDNRSSPCCNSPYPRTEYPFSSRCLITFCFNSNPPWSLPIALFFIIISISVRKFSFSVSQLLHMMPCRL